MNAPAPAFRFDAERHEYWLGRLRLTGVTEALSRFFPVQGPRDAVEHARERGSAVDAATIAWDKGTLDVDALDDEVVPYVLAWKKFREDSEIEIISSQEPAFHPQYLYAGTPDRVVRWGGRAAVPDIKATALILPTTALQTAAYTFGQKMARFTVHLRDDATYRIQEWKEPSDFGTFLSLLTVFNWERRNYECPRHD